MLTIPHLTYEALGYHIHTNRELGMMLRGTKPLAMFSDRRDNFPDSVQRYIGMFDRHAASGRFLRRDYFETPPASLRRRLGEQIHVILFALPAESWHIEAMIELRGFLPAWTDEHERRMGSLLGYEEWQNDVWMDRLRARRAK